MRRQLALAAMVGCIIVSVINWDHILQNKGGWNTLIWYGGIIGLSSALSKADFFKWMAGVFSDITGGGQLQGGYELSYNPRSSGYEGIRRWNKGKIYPIKDNTRRKVNAIVLINERYYRKECRRSFKIK